MTTTDEFAVAMQQLSAEAQKTLSVVEGNQQLVSSDALSQVTDDIRALNGRLETLERSLVKKIDSLADTASAGDNLEEQFHKINEQLAAIRTTDSVTQKLFDSLHAELLSYRDNFIHESLQKPFIHDLVLLFDDLSGLCEQLESAAGEQKKRPHIGRWRENLQNAIHSLVEILHRFGVKEVESKEKFDRTVHRVATYVRAKSKDENGKIVGRIRRGFVWRGKVIRPEEVVVKRFE